VPDDEHDVETVEELLDRIPGAYERTQEGRAQARRGEAVPLDEFADEPRTKPREQ
jgi:hypothetical protein